MQRLRNNWTILGAAVAAYVLSWLFALAFENSHNCFVIWTAFKAALPLIAVVCMYALAIRMTSARKRSKVIVHLTYPILLVLLLPMMFAGMMGSLSAEDAPGGAAVDAMCFFALLFGSMFFWLLRTIEWVVKMIRSENDVV
jgi:hypothetical protein